MHLLIGNKETFGIEIIIDSQNQHGYYLGYSRLWLGDNFIGTIEDFIYLNSYLLKPLVRMQDAKYFNSNSFRDSVEIFNYFKRGLNDLDIEIDHYRFNFGTMSDDFLIFAYKSENDLVIIWKLDRDSLFSDLKNYRKDVQQYLISQSDFFKHVDFLSKLLSIQGLVRKRIPEN